MARPQDAPRLKTADAPRLKTVNVKYVEADLWDALGDMPEVRAAGGMGPFISAALRLQFRIIRGEIKPPDGAPPMSEEQLTQRMFALAAMVQALAAAKTARLRLGAHCDIATARSQLLEALGAMPVPGLTAANPSRSKARFRAIPTDGPADTTP